MGHLHVLQLTWLFIIQSYCLVRLVILGYPCDSVHKRYNGPELYFPPHSFHLSPSSDRVGGCSLRPDQEGSEWEQADTLQGSCRPGPLTSVSGHGLSGSWWNQGCWPWLLPTGGSSHESISSGTETVANSVPGFRDVLLKSSVPARLWLWLRKRQVKCQVWFLDPLVRAGFWKLLSSLFFFFWNPTKLSKTLLIPLCLISPLLPKQPRFSETTLAWQMTNPSRKTDVVKCWFMSWW